MYSSCSSGARVGAIAWLGGIGDTRLVGASAELGIAVELELTLGSGDGTAVDVGAADTGVAWRRFGLGGAVAAMPGDVVGLQPTATMSVRATRATPGTDLYLPLCAKSATHVIMLMPFREVFNPSPMVMEAL
jgi:hypothetical protein